MILKCPNCGGQVVYDVETDMMKCVKCNKIYDRSTFDNYVGDHGHDSNSQPPQNQKNGKNDKPDFNPGYGTESTWVQGMADTQAELKIGHRNVSSAKRYIEMNVYHCNNCGADLLVVSTQASTFCSYCGSPSICLLLMPERSPQWKSVMTDIPISATVTWNANITIFSGWFIKTQQ